MTCYRWVWWQHGLVPWVQLIDSVRVPRLCVGCCNVPDEKTFRRNITEYWHHLINDANIWILRRRFLEIPCSKSRKKKNNRTYLFRIEQRWLTERNEIRERLTSLKTLSRLIKNTSGFTSAERLSKKLLHFSIVLSPKIFPFFFFTVLLFFVTTLENSSCGFCIIGDKYHLVMADLSFHKLLLTSVQ